MSVHSLFFAKSASSVTSAMSVMGLLALFAVAGARAQDKSSSGCWPWPDSLDAVAADPQNHIVMYEDSSIRVLDVHTPPHTTNSKHDHQWLSIFLLAEAQPKGRDHGTDGTATQPGGEVPADAPFPVLNVAGTQAPHAWENLDTFTKHFFRVEFKKIPFECPGKNGRMIFRNEAVQTLPPEVIIRPGQKQEMGETLWPAVLLFFEPQPKGAGTSYDGKAAQQVERKFEAAKFPAAIRMGAQPPHSFENKDNFPAHYYRVEFKKVNYKG